MPDKIRLFAFAELNDVCLCGARGWKPPDRILEVSAEIFERAIIGVQPGCSTAM